MPVDVIVLYHPPADPDAFDAHYAQVHVPLVRAMPHLVDFDWSNAPVDVQGGGPCHLMARLRFATDADRIASLESPAGQAAVADLANFADAGAVLVTAAIA